jgi:hypothetical protein
MLMITEPYFESTGESPGGSETLTFFLIFCPGLLGTGFVGLDEFGQCLPTSPAPHKNFSRLRRQLIEEVLDTGEPASTCGECNAYGRRFLPGPKT